MSEEVAAEPKYLYYALYSYSTQSSPEESGDNQSTENNGFSLSSVMSDLPESKEAYLSQFLFSKISKGLVYNDTGSISTFPYREDDQEKEMSCYYCKLSGADTMNIDINVGQGDTEGREPRAHVVCFLSVHTSMLDHFRQELDLYALGLFKFLEQNNETQIRAYLQKWSHETTEFLCRCVKLLGLDIKYLMYAALMDAHLVFEGVENKDQQDLQQFVKSCSLGDMLRQGESPMSGSLDMLADLTTPSSDDKRRTIQIKVDGSQLKFQPEYCTKFCEDWSQSVNNLSRDNPGLIKQVIEAGKLKYTQSINTLKRLMMQADSDYYALYRAYLFLKNSGNCEILLNCAHLELIPETYNVFKCLEEFVNETGVS
ncbi:protein Njmu-R1-like [Crassostrea virginica]|uniref:Protein Njmu-R1-like n=1 Tax=Crassostrea virginica TaxID=6565 RepID=A0A8B8CNY5_CRAVI|nr:protein Njmu-R1-like [Crassostrea virginica]